jgi:BirA family biotin operon repressor/biotin-[acetyl-CoA-carboxylase] ligase
MWSNIHHFESVTSTNDIALSLANNGAGHGTVVSAASQTKGRGRMGTQWGTEPGCLAMSVLLRPGEQAAGEADVLPNLKAHHGPRLTLIAAVAVCEALRALGAANAVRIKWPNDILLAREGALAKVCGILTELSSVSDKIDFAVIGIGINVQRAADGMASDIPKEAAFLSDIGVTISIEQTRTAILNQLCHFLPAATPSPSFLSGPVPMDFADVIALWRRWNVTLGSRIFVKEEGIGGWAKDIASDGALVIQLDDGLLKSIYAGTCEQDPSC